MQVWHGIRKAMRWGLTRGLDLLLPPECMACTARLAPGSPLGFCPSCYAALPWWDATRVLPPELPPAVASFKAPWLYQNAAREVLLRFKFADATAYAPALAKLFIPQLPPGATLLVPVPMHASRVRARTYNQAALLAQELGKISGIPTNVLALTRVSKGANQASKTRAQRLKLSGRDFTASPAVAGQVVVLIDDIYTTGATARACALALMRAGATAVHVRTLAYTPPGLEG